MDELTWARMLVQNNAKAAERRREAERRMWLRIIGVMAALLVAILLAILLEIAGLVSGIVTAVVIALAFGGLCGLTGWIVARNGRTWGV